MVDFNVDLDDIRRIKAGDSHRFNQLLNKYSVLIDSVKRKYEIEGYDGDDFAQIVRISIWKAVTAFDEGKAVKGDVPSQLTGLIRKIAKRDISKIFERCGYKKRTGTTIEFNELRFPTDAGFDAKVLCSEVSRLFTGVRAKIINFILQGYTQAEIAAELGFSQMTVSRHIQAIKKVAVC